jgi:hypothetical protein
MMIGGRRQRVTPVVAFAALPLKLRTKSGVFALRCSSLPTDSDETVHNRWRDKLDQSRLNLLLFKVLPTKN